MQKLPLFFAKLKTAFLANKAFAIVPADGLTTQILHIFIQQGIVLGVEFQGTNYKVILNHNFPLKMLTYVGPTKKNTWKKASELQKLNVAFAIISTQRGLLPLYEVQRLNIGGILLCKFDFTKI